MSTLFYNGKIFASEVPNDDQWTWMIVFDGKIQELGKGTPPEKKWVEAHDLQGKRVIPGLHDAHIHVALIGKLLDTVNCGRSSSISELQHRLKSYICEKRASNDLPQWISGSGWEQDLLARYPNRADLDIVEPSLPIVLHRVCWHVCVANSAALRAAGISRGFVAPAGGVVDVDSSGEPTGVLRETAADLMIALEETTLTMERKLNRLAAGLRSCAAHGLSSVHTNDAGAWPLYQRLAREGRLAIRVFLTVAFSDLGTNRAPPFAGAAEGPLLTCDRVKLFTDGALGASTAALSLPYVDPNKSITTNVALHTCTPEGHAAELKAETETPVGDVAEPAADAVVHGVLIHTSEALPQLVAAAEACGFRLEMHAIGDAAAHRALEALEKAGVGPARRPVLTHCQVLRPALVKRMAVNGVIANVQPQFVHTDSAWASRRLPPGLLSHAYAWKSLLTAGIRVAGGSDAPVEVPDPFLGLFCAVHRPTSAFPLHASRAALMADPNSHVPTHQVWRPHERLSIGEALHLYTHSAAYASMREGDLGTLRAGKLADFAVLSHDIVSDPCPATMLAANALQVWVGGRCVKRGAWLAGDLPVAEVHVNKPLRANL